jgi:hypothetical protein
MGRFVKESRALMNTHTEINEMSSRIIPALMGLSPSKRRKMEINPQTIATTGSRTPPA